MHAGLYEQIILREMSSKYRIGIIMCSRHSWCDMRPHWSAKYKSKLSYMQISVAAQVGGVSSVLLHFTVADWMLLPIPQTSC